ncbi:uncharacterized protein MELLADRAFT_69125 [Melampsora larici-populina 98AG31]|uniref:Uncharacterized protein n=1 Tax=Melampsora larici-populina (strain 98AG31 / pathotype 3-4-7) TaxID=747676 RepID=F4S9H2_MELLP|nr:uncharacterized protein MELLADRAFT_69125 [Melampsora larici-populina 98AG31]EGF98724.1 hypothetical protein MELLADRAFT_69125 [Melampsora larici-populina 98AG31]
MATPQQQQPPDSDADFLQLGISNGVSGPGLATPRGARQPASQSRPHQWAQAANSLGRRVPLDTMVMLQKHQAESDQASTRQASSLIDETKLVTINLWVNVSPLSFVIPRSEALIDLTSTLNCRSLKAVAAQPIMALFPMWPKAAFDESQLLLAAIQKAVGPEWNRALMFWDVKIGGWYTSLTDRIYVTPGSQVATLVNYPHRFPVGQRTIVARLPTVELPSSAILLLKQVLPPTPSPTRRPDTDAFRSAKELPPIVDMPSSPTEGVPSLSTSQASLVTPNPTSTTEVTPDEISTTGVTTSKSTLPPAQLATPRPTPIVIDLTKSPNHQNFERNDVFQRYDEVDTKPVVGDALTTPITTPPTMSSGLNLQSNTTDAAVEPSQASSSTLLPGWPSPILVLSLLEWYCETANGDLKRKWLTRWGAQYRFSSSTMYQYRLFVKKVQYHIFHERYANQPQAIVAEARTFYQDIFNEVARVGIPSLS